MPVRIGKVDAAEPQATLGATAVRGKFTGVFALRYSFAEPFFGFCRDLFHGQPGGKTVARFAAAMCAFLTVKVAKEWVGAEQRTLSEIFGVRG